MSTCPSEDAQSRQSVYTYTEYSSTHGSAMIIKHLIDAKRATNPPENIFIIYHDYPPPPVSAPLKLGAIRTRISATVENNIPKTLDIHHPGHSCAPASTFTTGTLEAPFSATPNLVEAVCMHGPWF